MSFKKKIVFVSAATLMALSPAVALINPNIIPVAQAAKTSQGGEITLNTYTSSDIGVILYDKNGKPTNKKYTGNQKIESGATIKFYGKPVILKGQKYAYLDGFPPERIINGHFYYDLGDGGYIKTYNVGSMTNNGKTLHVRFNSYIYDKNGKRLKSYRGGKAYVKKNTNIDYKGKVSPYHYYPSTYFNIGNGFYINIEDVAKLNGKGCVTTNYNSYIYNKDGKRTTYQGSKKLLKGSAVNYTGTISNTDEKSDYFYRIYEDRTPVYKKLTTHKIKGKLYYQIGKNAYIKADNVGTVNGHMMYTSQPTYVTIRSDMYKVDKKLQPTTKIVRAGQKIKVDQAVFQGVGDYSELYFRIKGTNEYLDWGGTSEYPEHPYAGDFDVRFNLLPVKYANITSSYIIFEKEKQTPLYNLNGEKIDMNGNYLEFDPDTVQSYMDNYTVDSAWYLWNPTERKAELYYHLTNQQFSVRQANTNLYMWNNEDLGNVFVKASEVKFNGLKLTPKNSASHAQEESKVATASQKEELQKLVDKAASIKKTDKYKLTTQINRINYDGSIKQAESLLKSDTATEGQIKFITWSVETTQKALTGAKVKVNNINNLTPQEGSQVLQVMRDACSALPNYINVQVYQHYAHKDGYYPTTGWLSNEKSRFELQLNGEKNRVLKISDYAVNKK